MAELEDIANLPGFGPSKIDSFKQAGYESLEDLRGISWDELGEIKGIKSSAKRRVLLNFLEERGLREKPDNEEKYEKFRSLLEELFQFESADLDFGVYRIMNEKRDRIEEFLDEELQDKVKQELEEFQATERGDAKERLEEAKERIKQDFPHWVDEDGNVNEDAIPDDAQGIMKERKDEYLEARNQAQKAEIGESTEAAIYQDLYRFFKRYYKDGDFIPQRRAANQEKYAIPYNGEEVTLYWANKDQYFVKTGERFKDYKFRKDSYDIEFQLHDAHVEKSNRKGEEKYFVLRDRQPIEQDGRQLVVHFEYRPLREKDYEKYDLSDSSRTKSRDIQEKIEERILSEVSSQLRETLDQETKSDHSDSTVLQRHLKNYRTKNENDYFIHKDLGEFLKQELDFYLKNEVFSWKELTDETGGIPTHVRARLNAIENIATEIIDFVSKIEDFQKRLYEKKKFVVKTEYCITLDNVPEEFYPEILDNEKQIEQWKDLYSLDQRETFQDFIGEEKIDEEFLKHNLSMMVDTKFFDSAFTYRLISEIDNIDEEINGVLIKGENYQSLNLLSSKYSESIDCIYIDPPYNTGNDEFIYKDNYQHSSWLSMLYDRLDLTRDLMNSDGVIFSSIDDHELHRLKELNFNIFGRDNEAATIVVRSNPRGRMLDKYIAKTHDYILSFIKNPDSDSAISEIEKQGEMVDQYNKEDERGRYRERGLRNRNPQYSRDNRPKLFFPMYIDPDTGTVSLEQTDSHHIEVYPRNSEGKDDCWRWGKEKVESNLDLITARQISSGDWRVYEKDYLRDESGDIATTKVKSIWDSKEYNNQRGKQELKSIMGRHTVDFPKPVSLIRDCVKIGCSDDGLVMDFFAGSGTTAQSVIELNNEENTNRRYILVDMADHLKSVAKPRIKKIIYSDQWEEGVPQDPADRSHLLKYIEIEDFEDTLHQRNLVSSNSQSSFDDFTSTRLEYYLNFEVDGPSLLDLDGLKDPFNYQMRIRDGDESEDQTIDLVETFNYLLGLSVKEIKRYENQGRGYRIVKGELDSEDIAIVWRPIRGEDGEDFFENERDFLISEVLEDEDIVYINYDSALPDTKSIEKAFQNRMWD